MPNIVVSKYFSTESAKTVMDDSLSDFQEKKKYNTGPKNVKKTRNVKRLKRTRGQKDIRALIKRQESEVLSYSKDFDKVCKQTGVDVDSEELQLAIALSKSLHQEITSETETKTTEHLSSQQRTLKIKTTLQEYGFKVPKVKTQDTNRRKKCKKLYKLLLISETERQQIISDRYSEVLARNIFQPPAKVLVFDSNDRQLYYKTTNIPYEYMKNNEIYYVKGLFDQPDHKACLLKDWSEIPGRPLSPTVEVNNINFDDIICDQYELDSILSGSIITAQQIVTNKNTVITSNNSIAIDKGVPLRLDKPSENKVAHIDSHVSGNKLLKEKDCFTNSNAMSVSEVRSISPDLFEDEVSTILECTDNVVQVSDQIVSMKDNVHTNCMDLTECINVNYYNIDLNAKTKLHTNNEVNITNRKSNDFMEITACVPTRSTQKNFENIDLTQSSNDSNDKKKYNNISQNEVMDLTQAPDCDAPVVRLCTNEDNLFDDTIILADEDFNLKLHHHPKNLKIRELSEPICIYNMNSCDGNSDTADRNKNTISYNDNNSCKKNENEEKKLNSSCKNVVTVTLANQTNFEKTSDKSKNIFNTETAKEHSSSDNSPDHICNNSYERNWEYEMGTYKYIDKNGQHTNKLVECQPDEIDLTQESNSSKEETSTNEPITNYSTSLGKRDNISIDYDEHYDNLIKENESQAYLKSLGYHGNENTSTEKDSNINIASISSISSEVNKLSDDQCKHRNFDSRGVMMNYENDFGEKENNNISNNNSTSNSKNSEVFVISDKELNYSLYQSKYESFDFRDVSGKNDISNFENNYNCTGAHHCGLKNRSLSESNLITKNVLSPFEKVTQSQRFNLNREISTPMRLPNENVKNILQTPKTGEYIIKTTQVTPMLDYALMSSPERHKELEKYGLKPFKRKRAIQLLTYLYNQTHPIVESHDDDCPSPSKRQKKDNRDTQSDLPKQMMKSKGGPLDSVTSKSSIDSISDVDKANDLYAVTNEQPEIRHIECDAKDWIFQKKEKAKLHSCRVPLHVAFHNYVTCRRKLREAILRYEPVNIDVIHKDLVATGYKYNPKDLLKFMDKKCITVRTTDTNSRNRKS